MRVDVGGMRLWFDVGGAGLEPHGSDMRSRPTLLLLHGGPGGFDHSYFKPDFAAAASFAQVVYLDLPGHGRSDWGDAEAWGFEMAGDAVHGFCQRLGIDRPVVLGHSFGGPVAIAYASRHPDHPAGLVLQSTFARFDFDRVVEGFRDLAGDDIAAIVRRSYKGDPTVTSEEWERCWKLFGPWVPGEVERSRIPRNEALNEAGGRLMLEFDLRADLAGIRCPTLVSVGALDPISPVWAGQEMIDGLTGADVELDVIEDAGHFPWRDRPKRYWESLEAFVAYIDGPW